VGRDGRGTRILEDSGSNKTFRFMEEHIYNYDIRSTQYTT
jgi:hypothetical protein